MTGSSGDLGIFSELFEIFSGLLQFTEVSQYQAYTFLRIAEGVQG